METGPHRNRRLNYYVDADGKPIPYVDVGMTRIRLSILKQLNDWHDLDTLLLYKLVEQDIGPLHYGRFQNQVTLLRKVAGYIHCPELQYQTINADYKRLVYSLTDQGKKVLKDNGVRLNQWGDHSASFAHDWMAAHCVASLKLAAPDKFIFPRDIAAKATVESPFVFPISAEKSLYPDWPVFGFDHGQEHIFCIWEMDCNTRTVKQMVEKIRDYLKLDEPDQNGDNFFWRRLRITTNYVCIVTTDPGHLRGILKEAPKSDIVLYNTIPHFSTLDYTPEPLTELWSKPWQRVGHPDFYLNAPEV
jgi:hypothetical protein